jgi:ribosomal protein L28
MDCRYCGTKLDVTRTTQEAHDRTRREMRCPTCKKRALSVEKIINWLAPTAASAAEGR